MNYDEIFERVMNNESITDEECEFIVEELKKKLINKEIITAQEIYHIMQIINMMMQNSTHKCH